MTKKVESKRFKLNVEDLTKVGKGCLIAGSGAILTYLAATILNVEFGEYTPIAVAIFSILANMARKWLSK